MSPHAGFIYSGDVVDAGYSQIEVPETVILLDPNHTGLGKNILVMTEGTWSMPIGNISIDEVLETQLPFRNTLEKKFSLFQSVLRKWITSFVKN
jgi:MEMO1 family protein